MDGGALADADHDYTSTRCPQIMFFTSHKMSLLAMDASFRVKAFLFTFIFGLRDQEAIAFRDVSERGLSASPRRFGSQLMWLSLSQKASACLCFVRGCERELRLRARRVKRKRRRARPGRAGPGVGWPCPRRAISEKLMSEQTFQTTPHCFPSTCASCVLFAFRYVSRNSAVFRRDWQCKHALGTFMLCRF